MKALKFFGFVGLLLAQTSLFSQQFPVLSSYQLNPLLSNPAFAGNKGNNVFLLNRNQWQNHSKNPETYLLTLDVNLKNGQYAYAFQSYNDVVNFINRKGVSGTFNYRIALPHNALLSVAATAGYEQYNLLDAHSNPEIKKDLSLKDNASRSNGFDGNVGIAYRINKLNIGLAGNRLLNANPVDVSVSNLNYYNYYFGKHIMASAAYQLTMLPGILSLDPSVRVRLAKSVDPQVDFSLMSNYKDMIMLGAGYRQQYGFDIMLGVKLLKKFTLAYTMAINESKSQLPVKYTNEIVLGYKFNTRKSNLDSDNDGVEDLFDKEPKTDAKCGVDKFGVSLDLDRDNVADCVDKQENTPFGAPVDALGIALDTDKDGVIDLLDQEADSPKGFVVDQSGIAIMPQMQVQLTGKENEGKSAKLPGEEVDENLIDTDHDNIPDINDKEPETPHWSHTAGKPSFDASQCIVDRNGVAMDSDGDGVMDCVDEEVFSPKGSTVNKQGIAGNGSNGIIPEKSIDSDGDGISDDLDLEPNTPKGITTDQWGRSPQVNSDPASLHRIAIEEIEDNSAQWNYYVIIGVFRYYNNLKNYQKYLQKTYNETSQVLVTDQNYYYAWTKQVSTRKEAELEVERLGTKKVKDYIVGNPWLWREPKKK
jgi:type IX secretion system PorP/SprF family membrane protein